MLFSFCTGCATLCTSGPFISREIGGSHNLPPVYQATTLDCIWLGEDQFQFYPALIIDLPISIAFDTVFLPFDSLKYCVKRMERSNVKQHPEENSEPKSNESSSELAPVKTDKPAIICDNKN